MPTKFKYRDRKLIIICTTYNLKYSNYIFNSSITTNLHWNENISVRRQKYRPSTF